MLFEWLGFTAAEVAAALLEVNSELVEEVVKCNMKQLLLNGFALQWLRAGDSAARLEAKEATARNKWRKKWQRRIRWLDLWLREEKRKRYG